MPRRLWLGKGMTMMILMTKRYTFDDIRRAATLMGGLKFLKK